LGKRKKKSSSFNKAADPHLEREASQYTHPVPSREFIVQYLEEYGHPASFTHLMEAFKLDEAEEREGLRRRLIAMCRDGQLMTNRRGSYALVSKLDLVRGHIEAHREGFGFLIPDDGSDDIFLPAREMLGVFNDDVVLVRVSQTTARRREGVIVEILERNTQQVVGRYFEERGTGFVDPDNKLIFQDITIPPADNHGAKHGQFVVVEITEQPTRRRQALGRVIEILGDHLTPGMEVELAIRSHGLPFRFSDEVMQEAQRFSASVLDADKVDRLDLRKLPFVTIDGEDAKDFDDAVYCRERESNKGYELYVAIADVSHYVVPETAMDRESQLRGNSVYFPAKVIPMLPETLSNGLCSLKPNEDRLAMVCIMQVSREGVVENYQFKAAVIHSHARLTYTQVAAMIADKQVEPKHLQPEISRLYALFKLLLVQREMRGAIEFDTLETKILFDDKGKIDKIVPSYRNDAHRLIEEMMLAANVCAAEFLLAANLPVPYRIHEGPQVEKLLTLRDFLRNFNLRLTGGAKPSAMDYSRLLERVRKRKDSHLLQTVLLRSLQQAIYSTDNVGHFGLAYEAYAHFTSPIRRYPDLLVHRAIKHRLAKLPKKQYLYKENRMEQLSEHCSMTERRADRATRDAVDWLKCEYMQDKVGQIFDGRIVEVTGFGIFVELNEIYVQGLVHVTNLPNDYYHYDDSMRLLRGKRSGREFRIADPIRVIVTRVDLDNRSIDFEPV
jgi:ribonuclease R